MGKYTLITKVLWHHSRDVMALEGVIIEMLKQNATSFAYVTYMHQDNFGNQF